MLKLVIPTLWQEDWETRLESADGELKYLILIQAQMATLLKELTSSQATPAVLGWMILWTRQYNILRGAQAALAYGSGYCLEFLHRITMETYLHIRTIGDPELHEEQYSEKAAKVEVLKRLVAYTAWCLWNDIHIIDDVWKYLDEVWDDSQEDRIQDDLARLRSYEDTIGPLHLVDDKTPAEYKDLHKERLSDSLTRMRLFIEENKELKSWFDELERRHKERNPIRSYFDMIYEPGTSLRERFKEFDTSLTYVLYQRGSLILHGSTFQGSFIWQGNSLSPNLVGSQDIPELLAGEVRTRSEINAKLLASFIREYKEDL